MMFEAAGMRAEVGAWKAELTALDGEYPEDFIPVWVEMQRKELICKILNAGGHFGGLYDV